MSIKSDKKYKAVWVSHSSMGDFLKCPRLYYLSNIYRDPKTKNKISIVNSHMVLGLTVHNVLESLLNFPSKERFKNSLLEKFEKEWNQFPKIEEIFEDQDQIDNFKELGISMIKRVEESPNPLDNKAVKIKDDLPHFWLSEKENIVLCGKIDWLEYVEEENGVKVIDFKTGKNKEINSSLQLPIYRLLVENCQSFDVLGASYWYLRHDDNPVLFNLPDSDESRKKVLEVALKIKEAREKEDFSCSRDGCYYCEPYEKIIKGEGKFIGRGDYGDDLYVLD